MPQTIKELQPEYSWLLKEPAPRILLEAIKLYGTKEITGNKHNPTIISWANEIGGWIDGYFTNDEIPWCGLFMAVCAKRISHPFDQTALGAMNWLKFGIAAKVPMLGDVMVFTRTGGGHVGLYVGEDDDCYHILGGNQDNMVKISRLKKGRFAGARRIDYRLGQPPNLRPIKLNGSGLISENES